MDKTIIITADIGHFKAYRITKEAMESPRVTLVESYDTIEGHGKLADKVSDAAGRFGRDGLQGETGMGSGERHNVELEAVKRVTKKIAADIDNLITSERCKKWHLAAGEKVNSQILECLKPEVKERLDQNLTLDLTKTDKSKILRHFEI